MTRCFVTINLNKTSAPKLTCLFLRKCPPPIMPDLDQLYSLIAFIITHVYITWLTQFNAFFNFLIKEPNHFKAPKFFIILYLVQQV